MVTISMLNNHVVRFTHFDDEYTFLNEPSHRDKLITLLKNLEAEDIFYDQIAPIWDTKSVSTEISVSALREDKRSYIKQRCHELIVQGIDCNVGLVDSEGHSRGTLHYSLTERHQSDMRDLINMIHSGQTQVTWRDDSRVSHEIYSADQFRYLYATACDFILSCRFRSDALELLLDSYGDDRDKISELNWDTEIPKEINDQIADLLSVMTSNN